MSDPSHLGSCSCSGRLRPVLVIVIDKHNMIFDHEKLDVYAISIEFTAWSFDIAKKLTGPNRHARDQLLRASQSIPQNIAEGNGKRSIKDRKRFFEIARGSAMECASILDILLACDSIPKRDAHSGKQLLHRIVAMLSKMTET